MDDELTNEQKLLVEQWVQAYRQLPETTVEKIKKEVNMSFVATTIKEHYINLGEVRGEARGVLKGKLEGKIENLEELHRYGIITSTQLEEMTAPLKRELEELQARHHPVASSSTDGHTAGANA